MYTLKINKKKKKEEKAVSFEKLLQKYEKTGLERKDSS